MKRIVLVHGWEGSPRRDWFPWLANELQEKGYTVIAPQLPHASVPTIGDWIKTLSNAVGTVDSETYFVGHSLGCQTILRFLETQDNPCGGAVFVAGFFTLQFKSPPVPAWLAWYKKIWLAAGHIFAPLFVRQWVKDDLDMQKLRKLIPRSIAILSDSDYFVSFDENKKAFQEKLNSKIIAMHDAGHICSLDGHKEVPEILNNLKALM